MINRTMMKPKLGKWLLIHNAKTFYNVDRIARNYEEGLHAIVKEGPWDCIIFGYDLEDGKTGYDIMRFLEQNTEFIPNNIMIISNNTQIFDKMNELKNKLLSIKDCVYR